MQETFFGKVKRRFCHYVFDNIRLLYNTIYKLFFAKDILIVNCSFKQWGGYVVNFNIGDDLNHILFHELSGKKVINQSEYFHNSKKEINIMGIGSIIEWKSNPQSIIWGSGVMNPNNGINDSLSFYQISSVRGKLTKQYLKDKGIECPDVFGDPALLLPLIYKPERKVRNNIGIIPHYKDLDNPLVSEILRNYKSIELIDVKHYTNWRAVIDKICSCQMILSSSLHGIIISDAYRIPNLWIKFSDKIAGGDFKYQDYFSAIGRTTYPIFVGSDDISDILRKVEFYKKRYQSPHFNLSQILRAAPFVLTETYMNLVGSDIYLDEI